MAVDSFWPLSPIPGFYRINAQNLQRLRIENISTGCLVADEQRDLMVELLLHWYSSPARWIGRLDGRDLGRVKNGQVYAESG
jgi:hypothetical protein